MTRALANVLAGVVAQVAFEITPLHELARVLGERQAIVSVSGSSPGLGARPAS